MGRIDVPSDYEGRMINVCGTADSQYQHADVQVEDRHARTLMVREDDDGRYVGPPEKYEELVREYLGVESGGTCTTVKSDGEECGRDLPCPYHSDEEGDS